MARQDVKLRYARSVIGPLWITITMALYVMALGFVFGGLFGASIKDVVPWIALGMIAWNLLANILTEASIVLVQNRGLLLQAKLSVSLFILVVLVRNAIISAHHLVIYLLLIVVGLLSLSWSILWISISLPLIFVAAFGVAMWAALMSARFHDLPPFFASLTTVGFLFVPVMWRPSDLQRYRAIADWNPLTHVLAALRDPLLGITPSALSLFVLGITALGCFLLGLLTLGYARRRVMFWI
jgi:ABC-type polysaccharide/polyol phosphate export permease